jgi:hypothetical protein
VTTRLAAASAIANCYSIISEVLPMLGLDIAQLSA